MMGLLSIYNACKPSGNRSSFNSALPSKTIVTIFVNPNKEGMEVIELELIFNSSKFDWTAGSKGNVLCFSQEIIENDLAAVGILRGSERFPNLLR